VGLEGKILITGASGFIGRRLADALLDEGREVISVRRAGSPEPKRGRSVVADYADLAGLTRIMEKERPDYVLHVAGGTKGRTYDDFLAANVMPTKNLVAALNAAHPGLKRFLHVSSLAAYGPSTPEAPLSEDAPKRPIEFYGRSKLESEQALESEAKIPWTIVRPSGVYGPGDVDYFNLFKSAAGGLNVFFGNEHRWFSAIYVDDCVRAILDATAAERTIGRGYFLSDGRPITWGQFQALVVAATPRKVLRLSLPEFLVSVAAFFGELATAIDKKPRLFNRQKAKMGAQAAWTCSHEQATRDFGFAPMVKVEAGVPLAAEWYRANGWI